MNAIRKAVMRYLRIFVSAGLAGIVTSGQSDPLILPLVPVIAVIAKLVRDQIGKKFPKVAMWLPI